MVEATRPASAEQYKFGPTEPMNRRQEPLQSIGELKQRQPLRRQEAGDYFSSPRGSESERRSFWMGPSTEAGFLYGDLDRFISWRRRKGDSKHRHPRSHKRMPLLPSSILRFLDVQSRTISKPIRGTAPPIQEKNKKRKEQFLFR